MDKNPGFYAPKYVGCIYPLGGQPCVLAGFYHLAAYRIRSGSWVWDPSRYHLQVLRSGDRGELQRIQYVIFCGGVKSSWMFIYLFFSGGGGIFPHICFMFLRDFETNTFETPRVLHVGKHAGLLVLVESCHPILVDRQVLGSYEVGWPNKASICWNLSWVTLWHLTVLPTGLKRQVESRLEIDILMICFVIYF